jgi:ankyrin repeat protein
MWLPADETRALEVARLFLELGADPTVRNKQGLTAADLASRRSLDQVAELLRDAEQAH